MTITQMLLPEFEQEMANTRKVLERVPDDRLEWKAHPKSNTIRWVASHLAEIAGWLSGTLTQADWDIQPVGGERYRTPQLASRAEILEHFDRHIAEARAVLLTASDEMLMQNWSLLEAGKPLFTMPRVTVIRNFVLNHTIHHRAILCVYLRLNDIPVPGLYGPSGDDA